MKASKAQSRIIKQNKQMIALLILIAEALEIGEQSVLLSLDVQETIAPTKKPSRTRAEVAQDQAVEEEAKPKPDSRNMSQSVPQDEGDNSDSPIPNELPDVGVTALTEAFSK